MKRFFSRLKRIAPPHRHRLKMAGMALCLTAIASLAHLSPSIAKFDPNAEMPTGKEDFTAWRSDCEVWGWNEDFTEMAALSLEVARSADGEQLGEVLLLVYPVGSNEPIHSVHQLVITQAARPFEPAALEGVFNRMWGIGHNAKKLWPKKPKHKHYKGAMFIEPMWHPVEVSPGICSPMMGYILQYREQIRYQPHERLKMRAPCKHLRMTDIRAYWAKQDLGAVMPRFDYSSTDNEKSVRYALSVAWRLGRPVRIALESGWPKNHARQKRMHDDLLYFGDVTLSLDPTQKNSRVAYTKDFAHLARHLAELYDATLEDQPRAKNSRFDILVITGPETKKTPADASASHPSKESAAERSSNRGANIDAPEHREETPQESRYLDDFAP